jgi:hypothetical protein
MLERRTEMLRGVNKQIIEIIDTGSDYFEKAVFFVKADNKLSNSKLEKEAEKIMNNYFNNNHNGGHKGFLRYTEEKRTRTKKISLIVALSVFLVTAAAVGISYFL